MAFQLSPGVNVTEIDLTTVVPAVATSDGAFAGVFRWGPVGERVFIDSENSLVKRFGKPTNLNPETFFTAANFLSYANRLYISRAANTTGSTPYVAANVISQNASIAITSTNINTVSVGMYVTQVSSNVRFTSNASSPDSVTDISTVIVRSKNASHVVLSHAIKSGTANGFNIYFGRPETAYTAVGFDSVSNTNAKAANLVNQIVKNENEYVMKDGSCDEDVV